MSEYKGMYYDDQIEGMEQVIMPHTSSFTPNGADCVVVGLFVRQ